MKSQQRKVNGPDKGVTIVKVRATEVLIMPNISDHGLGVVDSWASFSDRWRNGRRSLESRIRENRTYGIDEGELEIEPSGYYASSLLY